MVQPLWAFRRQRSGKTILLGVNQLHIMPWTCNSMQTLLDLVDATKRYHLETYRTLHLVQSTLWVGSACATHVWLISSPYRTLGRPSGQNYAVHVVRVVAVPPQDLTSIARWQLSVRGASPRRQFLAASEESSLESAFGDKTILVGSSCEFIHVIANNLLGDWMSSILKMDSIPKTRRKSGTTLL